MKMFQGYYITLLLTLLAISRFLKEGATTSIRFRDDSKDVYILKTSFYDRHPDASNSIDHHISFEHNKDEINSDRSKKKTSISLDDHDNEVQSFLVLKLPRPFLSKSITSNSISSGDVGQFYETTNVLKTTKFTVNEGGFEAEGELEHNGASDSFSQPFPNTDSSFIHQSMENEFTARILTFRVGREKPVLRVFIFRKSMAKQIQNSDVPICVGIYVFHPNTDEILVGYCLPFEKSWPSGVCIVELVVPLKWWKSLVIHDEGVSPGGGKGTRNKFTKIKIGFSVYVPSSNAYQREPNPSGNDNYCRSTFSMPAHSTSSQSSVPKLSAQAQYSLRIIGEVELIYPSEYALLPLNNVLKVLIPTIDYYPGVTFTVPIFVHYEPSKLNNGSIYLIQLRALTSDSLRIVGVEDIDPDWTINYTIENSATMVTSTAYHRSISLNESWAGEVFVLIIKINRDATSSGDYKRPQKTPSILAQLTWSVRLVIDNSVIYEEKNDLDNEHFPSDYERTTSTTPSGIDHSISTDKRKRPTETISTQLNVQPDSVDTLAVIGNDEIVNTAVINGQQVSLPIRIISVSQGGNIEDVTQKCHCVAIDSASLKVSAECSSIYVDGSETKSNANAAVGVQYGSYRTVARYTVWYPEFPVDIWLADPVLHAVSGWYVPTVASSGSTKEPRFRKRRHNEQRRRTAHRRSKSTTMNNSCRQKFQETEVKIYARFRAADSTTGGQLYLGGEGRKMQVDLTQMARSFLRVKNSTVAKLVHTKYETYVEGIADGRTEIQLKSPIQRHIYGSSFIETANERVHVKLLSAQVMTGLFFHTQSRNPYPPIYNVAVYKSSIFFRRYQEGTVSLNIRYSDGQKTNLDALDSTHYRLRVITNGTITVFPGSANGRRRHSSSSNNDFDNDGLVFLPVRILTVDEHADGARLNVTLAPPSSCQEYLKEPSDQKEILAYVNVPIEFPIQNRNPIPPKEYSHSSDTNYKSKLADIEFRDDMKSMNVIHENTPILSNHPSSEHSLDNDHHGYGNVPLLASISVSIFAVAGILFAACAVREGWLTVKTFQLGRCRYWRLLIPLNMAIPPMVFTSSRCSRMTINARRDASSNSSENASVHEDGDDSPPSNRLNTTGRYGKRSRNSKYHTECTESSVVSAENEFVWLRPMSSSSSNGPLFGSMNATTGARSLNGDLERHSMIGHRSLNGEIERRLANTNEGRDNVEYVVSEDEFFNSHTVRKTSSHRRNSGNIVSSSSSTISSKSNTRMEFTKDDECGVDDTTFTDNDPDIIPDTRRSNFANQFACRIVRKMSDVIQGQRASYILHEGATTLPSGWSGSEDYGSVGSPMCPPDNKYNRNPHKRYKQCENCHRNNRHGYCNSSAEQFVQRLLSARSDPTVHIRPTPTTAEAAAAAVEAAKRNGRENQNVLFNHTKHQIMHLRNGLNPLLGNPIRNSVCSTASSAGTGSDIFWDSSTLGMNENELRNYFNCLRESVT